MTMLKKLVGGLATVATVASLAVLPTFVLGSSHGDADLYGGNNDTGYRSRNRNRHDIRTTYRNNRVKRAVVRNTANVTGNTGGNNQNKNTTGGDLDSGEVEVLADVINHVNQSDDGDDDLPESAVGTINLGNNQTGPRSRNTNRVKIRHDARSSNRKVADVRNTVNVDGTTGNNDQNKNTTGGDLTSGEVDVDFIIDNLVN